MNKWEKNPKPHPRGACILILGERYRQKYIKTNIRQGLFDAKRKLNTVSGAKRKGWGIMF